MTCEKRRNAKAVWDLSQVEKNKADVSATAVFAVEWYRVFSHKNRESNHLWLDLNNFSVRIGEEVFRELGSEIWQLGTVFEVLWEVVSRCIDLKM